MLLFVLCTYRVVVVRKSDPSHTTRELTARGRYSSRVPAVENRKMMIERRRGAYYYGKNIGITLYYRYFTVEKPE